MLSQQNDKIELIDSHCHLDQADFSGEIDKILETAKKADVIQVLSVGADYASSLAAVELAQRHSGVFAAVGIHPESVQELDDRALACLAELSRQKKVVAWGEIGLDYALMPAGKDVQTTAFIRQLELARQLELPVIIHDREAHADTLACIKEAGPFPRGGVMHCFSGELSLAEQMIGQGFMISISGVITFKNAAPLREIIKAIGLEHLIVETDAPYLTPVPFRGKRNQSAYVRYTAQAIAELIGLPLHEVARITTANARKLFRLPEVHV